MQKLYALTDLSALLLAMPGAHADSAGGAVRSLYRDLRDDERETDEAQKCVSTIPRTQH